MFKRTAKQQRAIEAKGNILISAAAGSGKTSVMTERICNIIASGEAGIDEVLVLTFTDMAAAEMKKRIYNQLYELSVKQSSETLGILAERVTQADISTVHSFCQRVIREKYFVLGLSPSFHISADKESKRLLSKSLSDLLEEKREAVNAEISGLFERYGKRNGKPLIEMILALFDEINVLPEPEDYKSLVLSQYDSDAYKAQVKHLLTQPILKKFDHAEAILNEMLSYAKRLGASKAEMIIKSYLNDVEIDRHLFSTKPFDEFASRTVMTESFSYKEFADDVKDVFKTNKEYVKKLLDGIHEETALIDFDKQYHQEISLVKTDAKALLDIVFMLKDRYQQAKQKKNALDFNDLEHFAYTILKDKSHNADFKYKFIFVDEYQDTNPLQEAIINQIKSKNNCFMVGDVKQSIYAFRHAEPKIFLNKQQAYREQDQTDDKSAGELVRMNENFRSSKPVIDGINAIMGRLLTPDFGGIDYQNKEALVHHGALTEGKMGLTLIDTSESLMTGDEHALGLSEKEAEAYAVAKQIQACIGKPIYSRETGQEKPLAYSDIVVLLRELSTSGAVYKRVFESCGIPVDCEISAASAKIPEVDVFANLLKIILNPTDDIALLSVMRFASFGFTSDDFAAIRMINKDKSVSFYACVNAYRETNHDALAEKLNIFFETLTDLRIKSKVKAKADFLNHCYHTLGFESILFASPKRSVKADILKAYISALISETPETAGLSRVVEYIDDLKQRGESLDFKAPITSQNVVRIMTVHKSKGLEFPVVFMSGLDKAYYRENRASYVFDKDMGLGFKITEPRKNYQASGIIYQAILEKKAAEALDEEVRLLYVAMTRAENQLYLIGARSALKTGLSRWLMQKDTGRYFARSNMDLIMPLMLNKHAFLDAFESERFLPNHLSAVAEIPIDIQPKTITSDTTNVHREDIMNRFLAQPASPIKHGYNYPFDAIRDIPSKRSVSSLKQNESEAEKTRKEVVLDTSFESALSGAMHGSAFHKVMEHIAFDKKDESQIMKTIEALVERHVLTAEEAHDLSIKDIQSVLSSDIIARAQQSKTVFREKNFSQRMNSDHLGYAKGASVIIQGTIDLCFIEDGAFVVVDYKTDRATTPVIESRLSGYKQQIAIYADAIASLTGVPVKERIIYLVHHGIVKI